MTVAQSPGPLAAWSARRAERQLLLACLATMGIGFLLALASGQGPGVGLDPALLLPLGIYAACVAALHLAFVAAGFRGDQVLAVTAVFLAGLGLLVQTRMGTFDGAALDAPARLLFPAGMGVLVATALLFAGGRYRLLGRIPWVWAGLSLLLVAVLLATGQRFRGAVFGAGLTTPTEALKIAAVLFLAAWVERRARDLARWHPRWPVPPWRPLWPLAAFWALLTGLLLVQRDLGMTAILGSALLAVLVAGTGRIGYGVYGALAAAGLGWLALRFFEHGSRRIDAWLDPFADPTGDGWQILQGLSGMFAGGLWGEGFGQGSPQYTPIAHSDFVYTVIGEELGFVGTALVLVFYLVLLQRGLKLARGAGSPFGRLLATGLTTGLAVQVFLNVGGVTKLIPLTGITLPLLSQGGASLLTTCAVLGLLLAVSDGVTGAGRAARGGAPARSRPGRTGGPAAMKAGKARSGAANAGRSGRAGSSQSAAPRPTEAGKRRLVPPDASAAATHTPARQRMRAADPDPLPHVPAPPSRALS